MTSDIHTTLIQTEGPHRVTVEAAPSDGEWCRVFHWFIDHIMPDMRGGAVKVQLCICRNADRFTGLCGLSRGEIAAKTKLSPGTVSDEIKGLLAHPARLLAEQGSMLATFPGHTYAGRSMPPPPDSTGRNRLRPAEDDFDGPNRRVVSLRAPAPSQPEEEPEELAWTARGITKDATRKYMDARGRGMAGWIGYPLHWDLEGVTCPKLALGMLDLREPRRQQVLDLCPDLTVEEIVRTFDQIRMGTNAKNPPVLLAYRLVQQRGRQLPKAAPVHDRAALDWAREMEALRAGRRA